MFPPEANYYSMVSGAGPAPMLAYGDALVAHAATMTSVVGVSSATAVGTSTAFVGQAGSASEAALVSHNSEHSVFAEETLARAQIAHLAAAAHPATVARMVPAPPIHANRLEEATDELINPLVWGALTPRIVDLNAEYFGFMWPNNAAAGVSYGAALDGFGAALMTPSLPAMSGGSVAAVGLAAATVAEGAALTGMQAAVQAVSTGVGTMASPAAALPAAAVGAVTSSASSVSSAPATSSTPAVQPMAAVQHTAPPAPAQPMAPAQSTAGMFASPPTAQVMTPPPVPPTVQPPAVQPLTPRPPIPPAAMPAAPGVTSFVPPAQPFSPPTPTAGRAGGLKPGMLNAAALRGPVSTMPLTTTATSTLATATQPLAYVPPDPPRPNPVPPTPPHSPPLNPGNAAQTLNPPPQPQQAPPPPPHTPPQPSAPQDGPPGPATGSGGPEGSGGPGTQMPGSGSGQAPPAPPVAVPLDTRPPVPPPPEPGEPPLRPPTPPSWALPPLPKSVQSALDELQRLETLIQHHNSNPPSPSNLPAVADYNAEADYYNAWAAQLQGQLGSWNAEYNPATTANSQAPSWTQPAPPPSTHPGPGSQPRPDIPSNPSLADQANQIAKEVSALPKGSGQLQNLADKVTGLHLSQQEAAEVTDIAAKGAFGDTGGIASLPDGTKMVLPARIDQGVAMVIHPDGSVTVFKGDLTQFLRYLGR
jgi:PPE family